MNDRVHVESVDALRAFMDEFKTLCGDAQGTIRSYRLRLAETCAWVERCHDDARSQLAAAEASVAECESSLWACESSGDEDYQPDCSSEQDALDEARETEALWRQRVETTAHLRHVMAEAKQLADARFQHESRSIADVSAQSHSAVSRYIGRINNASAP